MTGFFVIFASMDEKFMQEALREAQAARSEGEVPIGAVVVCRGRVIARGHNMTERLNDPTAHAEMIALTAATEAIGGKYLNDCTLYVTVEPCPMCAAALCWAQIGRIVYAAPDPRRGYSLFSPSLLHPKTEVTILSGGDTVSKGQFVRAKPLGNSVSSEHGASIAEQCSTLVSDFFKAKR